jgi:hypothetical protein
MLFVFSIATPLRAQDDIARDRTPTAEQGLNVLSELPARQDTLYVIGGGPFLIRPFLLQEGFRVQVNDVMLDTSAFALERREGLIRFGDVAPDSALQVVISYRYVPLELEASYALWGRRMVESAGEKPTPQSGRASSSTLQTRGQVTRGVLTGSNQSARIESGLRLQVEGEIAPGVRLEAELTDEDTPLVPEGVTRQFDQFDRIRIGFSSDYGRVDLGDFDALLQGTRYGHLQRKLQGAGITTSTIIQPAPGLSSLQISAGAAISRGQFHAIDLDIKEGVQGPYRLLGASGERFILVLPGTERVFLDGSRMERGSDQDYTMDYSLGELTFTARHLMGPDRRVRIEYEYTTNRYTRTLSFAQAAVGLGGNPQNPWARLVIGGIREADGAAFIDEQGLTAQDSALVAQSTDGEVQVDGAVRVIYDPEALFTHYTRTQGTRGDFIYEEFIGSADVAEEVYRVPFSFVGEGFGAYRRIPSLSGGIAYEWLGEGEGAYIAARTLPVPSRKMLGEARLHILGIPRIQLETGIAGSSQDRNRLSPGSDSEISGLSWDVSAQSDALAFGESWRAKLAGSLQNRGASFETFERIRSVEYARDWSLPITAVDPFGAVIEGAHETLAELSATVRSNDSSTVALTAGHLQLGSLIEARRFGGDARFFAGSHLLLSGQFSYAYSDGNLSTPFNSEYRRSVLRAERIATERRWMPWAEMESTEWSTVGDAFEGLTAAEQSRRVPFMAYRVGVTKGWAVHQLGLSGAVRDESAVTMPQAVFGGSRIQTGQGTWTYEPTPRMRSSASLGVRRSTPTSTEATPLGKTDSERALLVGWSGQIRNADSGTIRWEYSVRSEQTAAMQEVFIRAGSERGSYVWLDSNNDSQIQLDEYFPETTPGEGEYARTLFPSDSLESVTTAEARVTYSYLPTPDAPLWRKARWQSTVDLRETSRSSQRSGIYLLKPSALRQPGETISGQLRIMQRLGLFPLRSDREFELRLLRSSSLAELANGSESLTRLETGLAGQEQLSANLDVILDTSWMQEEAGSERFASRQFDISRWEIRPGSVLRRGNARLQTELLVGAASESVTDARVRTLRLPVNLNWTRRSATWRTGGEWADASISGGAPIGLQLYELTEGRGAGQSWMWHLHVDIKLTDVMTATLRYDGRRPSSADTIHTGRFHLTARF